MCWVDDLSRLVRLAFESVDDDGFRLLGCSFFDLEEIVETALLDGLEKGSGDVHMCVEGLFTSGELGEGGDGCFEIGGVGGEISARCEFLNLSCKAMYGHLGDIVDIADTR
jgi:hypothetical protein